MNRLTTTTALAAFLALGALAGRARAQAPAPPQNNLVYEIFVRSFCASNDAATPRVGDLKGVAGKLDSYLNDGDPGTDADLEVGILWLTPIFPSPSDHGYDVADYRDVNPEFGSLDDLKGLLREAHKRGVRVILDIPFGHTSDRHPWFQDALRDPRSPHRAYYRFEPDRGPAATNWHPVTGPGGEKLRYFGLFGGQMPDLDFDNPKVRQEAKDTARFWLDLGVDGFRLDAAKHIYCDSLTQIREPDIAKNNAWWLEFSRFVYGVKPDAVLVGEVLGSYEVLRRHAPGLAGLLDEPFMNAVRSQAGYPRAGLLGPYGQFLDQARKLHQAAADPASGAPWQPFRPFDYLASPDRNPRLASDFEDMKNHGMAHGVDEAYRLALSLLLTVSSRPVLYQGDEVMQRGWKANGDQTPRDRAPVYDETLREPFPWYKSGAGPGQTTWFASRFDRPDDGVSREEQGRPGGMLDLVRGLSHLRARHPALADGDLGAILTDTEDWTVFERRSGPDHFVVLVNLTARGNSYNFNENWFPEYVDSEILFWSDGAAGKWKDTTGDRLKTGGSVFVPPFGLVVIRRAN